jgi:hypothetical protein
MRRVGAASTVTAPSGHRFDKAHEALFAMNSDVRSNAAISIESQKSRVTYFTTTAEARAQPATGIRRRWPSPLDRMPIRLSG